MEKRILLLTDNEFLLYRFQECLSEIGLREKELFDYAYSSSNKSFRAKYGDDDWLKAINVKKDIGSLVEKYFLIISLHCKQLFPEKLIEEVKCINIHPGLNPYNRGWYPQVFSIINGLPVGATIHEIDSEIDHGVVICQKRVEIESWDTSLTAYNKILEAEMDLVKSHLDSIVRLSYSTSIKSEGNLNLKKDFDELCEINLGHKGTFQEHINLLRALTHGDYQNAYFFDEHGNKVYVSISLKQA